MPSVRVRPQSSHARSGRAAVRLIAALLVVSLVALSAYLLRDPSKKRETWEDLKKVREYLDNTARQK